MINVQYVLYVLRKASYHSHRLINLHDNSKNQVLVSNCPALVIRRGLEYADCILCGGVRISTRIHQNVVSCVQQKFASGGQAPVLELWRMWSTTS